MKTRKIVTAIIASAMILSAFAACGKQPEAPIDVTVSEDHFGAVVDAIDAVHAPTENGMMVIDQANISAEFGNIDMSYFSDVYAYSEAEYPYLERIFVGVAKDKESLSLAKEALEQFPAQQIEIYKDYDPEAAKNALNSRTVTNGLIIFFVIHEDFENISDTVTDAIDYSKGLLDETEVDSRIATAIDSKKGTENE